MSSSAKVQPFDDRDATAATEFDEEAVECERPKAPRVSAALPHGDQHRRRFWSLLMTGVTLAAVIVFCVLLPVVLNDGSGSSLQAKQLEATEDLGVTSSSSRWDADADILPQDHDRESIESTPSAAFSPSSATGADPTPEVAATPFDPVMFYPNITDGQCPSWVKGAYPELLSISVSSLDLERPRGSLEEEDVWKRSFAVEPSHTVLRNDQDQVTGVVFNVETTPEALYEHLHKQVLSSTDVDAVLQRESGKFYQNTTAKPYPPAPNNVTLEAQSNNAEQRLVFAGGHGFFAATMTAFAQHLPLALTADDLWAIIVQGFSRHVDEHAEELRHHFASSPKGTTVRIHIREDRIRRFQESPPERWEQLIFPKVADRIQEEMSHNLEAFATLTDPYSTTTPASQAASQIALMASLKSYFTFSMTTACGIPKIRLEGTLDDWLALRDRTARLADWMMPEDVHGELWITDIILPILDEFVNAFQGTVDICFWQSMIKFRSTGDGSGNYDFLSGWLPTLFPYLTGSRAGQEPNPYLRPWKESADAENSGPRPHAIPVQVSSVPVMWTFFEQEIPVHFHAGFRGMAQEEDGTLKPVLGWYITDDPIDVAS